MNLTYIPNVAVAAFPCLFSQFFPLPSVSEHPSLITFGVLHETMIPRWTLTKQNYRWLTWISVQIRTDFLFDFASSVSLVA